LYRVDSNGNSISQATLSEGLRQDGDVKGAKVIKIQANGKILIGGEFTTYNGAPANYLVRVNPRK
jgi:hypothetical protein